MCHLKSVASCLILPCVATLLSMAPMHLHAQNASYPCQGLLIDSRDTSQSKVFIEDLTLQISDKKPVSLSSKSNLSGISGFTPKRQDLQNSSDTIHWRAWTIGSVDGISVRNNLSVNKFNGHFTFQTKQNNQVVISLEGICELRKSSTHRLN